MPDRDHRRDEDARTRLIPPPRVRPIEGTTEPAAQRHGRGRWPASAIVTVLFLALLATATFVFLPRWAARQHPAAREGGAPAGPAPAGESAAAASPDPMASLSRKDLREDAYLRERAEQARDRVLTLRHALEKKGVALWARELHVEAVQHVEAGQDHLMAHRFPEAEAAYGRAADALREADSRSAAVLAQSLAEGRQSLVDGNAVAAGAAFSLALRISPGNQVAATGLGRAEVLDDVRVLLDSGARSERNGDLLRSEESYRAAVALDPLSQEAQESLARIESRRGDDDFARFMSEGLAALERRDYDAATEALRGAERVRPGSAQVAEALAQVAEEEKLQTIDQHRRQALAHEVQEEWRQAAGQYEAALALEPTLRFAQEGAIRSRKRADLADRLDYHVAHPDRLSSDAVVAEVSALLEEARSVTPAGRVLQDRIEQLQALVEGAQETVHVVLESDNLTEVIVYRIGSLGAFHQRELELRPGTYTVVGSRQGYRDVRHELVVVAGAEPETIVVRCEEEI